MAVNKWLWATEKSLFLILVLVFSGSCLRIGSKHGQISPTIYEDNLEESNFNYYYGSSSVETYLQNEIKFKSLHNTSKCNFSTPYANFTDQRHSCFACQSIKNGTNVSTAKVLFNLETRSCEICTSQKTSICNNLLLIKSEATNKTSISLANQTNSKATSKTNSSTVKNETSVQNSSLALNGTNITSPKVTLNQTLTSDTSNSKGNASLCPPERPFYNVAQKLCDSCPKNQEYQPINKTCVPIIYMTLINATNLIMPNQSYLQSVELQARAKNPTRNIVFCPSQTPYLQNGECISCQNGQFYNVTNEKCVLGCNEGYVYQNQTSACIRGIFTTNPDRFNLLSQSRSYNAWRQDILRRKNASMRVIYCNDNQPFAVNGTCISCQNQHPYFDIDVEKCTSCATGRYYSSGDRMCRGYYSESSSIDRKIGNIL